MLKLTNLIGLPHALQSRTFTELKRFQFETAKNTDGVCLLE